VKGATSLWLRIVHAFGLCRHVHLGDELPEARDCIACEYRDRDEHALCARCLEREKQWDRSGAVPVYYFSRGQGLTAAELPLEVRGEWVL